MARNKTSKSRYFHQIKFHRIFAGFKCFIWGFEGRIQTHTDQAVLVSIPSSSPLCPDLKRCWCIGVVLSILISNVMLKSDFCIVSTQRYIRYWFVASSFSIVPCQHLSMDYSEPRQVISSVRTCALQSVYFFHMHFESRLFCLLVPAEIIHVFGCCEPF